jgi:prefoldin subunit 5
MTDHVFERLAALSQDLNETSDLVSRQIAEVESALNALRLGVRAWVDVERSVEKAESTSKGGERHYSDLTRVLQLGYIKHQGQWRLVIADGYEELWDVDDFGAITALREAKRDVKLAAVDKIPALLVKIEEEATRVTQQATEKAQQLKDVAAALGKTTR